MPRAIIYALSPTQATSVPTSLGRATHAAFLRLIQAVDPDLAARIHDEEGIKPITVSNIFGLGAGRSSQVDPERSYILRVTLLTPELERIAADWSAEALGTLDLDGHQWRVTTRTVDATTDPWAGTTSYEQLAAPLLERPAELPSRWEFSFAAPVTFRRRGVNLPLPMPELVFGSLLDKWNAFSPIALPGEVRRYAEECLAVSRYDLRSVVSPTSGGALQIGAIGRCTYTAVSRDRYWQACITTLARLAFYTGIGAGTSRGFGQARLLGDGAS
jgi:CRISPR-associated endoribonuclease Cas6